MLISLRAAATSVALEKMYGRAERMSSTGAGRGSVGTAGLVLTGCSVLSRLTMALERLSERYAEHNRLERGAGFVFAGPERAELFRRQVGGPGRRVLDLGCRDGALTRVFAEGNQVVGVDADKDALAEAEKLGIETRWADLDDPLPFEDESFDVVVAGELLEHLRDPHGLIAEARRVLRGGGTFVASVPNAYRLKNRLRFVAGRKPEDDPTHLQMFSADDVRTLLSDFEEPQLRFIAGRLVPLHARLFANDIVFSGRKSR
jgi:methionine biosynthesis protein MetW